MTPETFQKRYHDYMVHDETTAQAEADLVNTEGIDGERVVAVNCGVCWGLMLESAYAYVREIGVDISTEPS